MHQVPGEHAPTPQAYATPISLANCSPLFDRPYSNLAVGSAHNRCASSPSSRQSPHVALVDRTD